jgi:hypothetical protein
MTDLLTRDPNDTGDIPHPDLVDTHVLDVGQTTQAIRPYELDYPALRRSDLTDEQPLYDPTQTVQFALPGEAVTEILAIQGPQSPPPPIPPNPGPVIPPRHALTGRVGEYPVVRPSVPPAGRKPGRRRRGRLIAYGVLTGIGSVLLFEAVVTLGAWLVLR